MSSTAGRVLLMPKGDYDNTATYTTLDVVIYGGLPYVAKQTTTGNLPSDTTYWQKLVDMPTQVDNVPTESSDNLVKSGGVYSALTDKADNSKAYQTDDGTENIADADYIPFYDSSATAKKKTLWSSLKSIIMTAFTGATSATNGVGGDVPAPQAGDEDKFLKGDGSWADVPTRDVYYEQTATLSTNTPTTVTFTDATASNLPTNARYSVSTSIVGVMHSDIDATVPGTVDVTFPAYPSGGSVSVRLYVHYSNV